jgi:hypothetical protein
MPHDRQNEASATPSLRQNSATDRRDRRNRAIRGRHSSTFGESREPAIRASRCMGSETKPTPSNLTGLSRVALVSAHRCPSNPALEALRGTGAHHACFVKIGSLSMAIARIISRSLSLSGVNAPDCANSTAILNNSQWPGGIMAWAGR